MGNKKNGKVAAKTVAQAALAAEAAAEKSKGFFKEFKEFISKGNVVDMAVGIIIGSSFTAIVTSLVQDLIMPVISLITGGIDFTSWFVALDGSHYATLEAAKAAGASTLNYGNFINFVINFLIVAFCVFLMVKMMNRFRKKKEAAPAAPSQEQLLLTEIRDLLKEQVRQTGGSLNKQ